MKKTLIYVITVIIASLSCRTQKVGQQIAYGTFEAVDRKNKGLPTSHYSLKLNSDNTFSLIIKFDIAAPQCSGKWKIASNKGILLMCDESANAYEAISSAYMNEREYELQVLNEDKLKYKKVVLKRKK